MTIAGWVGFGLLAVLIGGFGFATAFLEFDKTISRIIVCAITVAIIVGILSGMLWLFANTAGGRRAMIDQKSNLENGLERVVTVYTADGQVIARYEGRIDLEANSGGYIKFDFEGKRYIYYNCFVESVAKIDEESA